MKRSFYISRKKEGWEGKKEEVTEKGNKEGKVEGRQCCTILRNWKTSRTHHSTKLKENNKLRKTLNSLPFISLFTKCCYWSVSCHYVNVPSFSDNNWGIQLTLNILYLWLSSMIRIWTTHLSYVVSTSHPCTVNSQLCLLKPVMEFTSSSELWDTPHSFDLKFYKPTFILFTCFLHFYSCLSHYPHLLKTNTISLIYCIHTLFFHKNPPHCSQEFCKLIIPTSFPQSRSQHLCLLVYKAKTREV